MISCVVFIETFGSILGSDCLFFFRLVWIHRRQLLRSNYSTLCWLECIHTKTEIKIFTFFNRFRQNIYAHEIGHLIYPETSLSLFYWIMDQFCDPLFWSYPSKYELSIYFLFRNFVSIHSFDVFIVIWDRKGAKVANHHAQSIHFLHSLLSIFQQNCSFFAYTD